MTILRRYLAKEILSSILLVFAALLALLAFFDLMRQLQDIGQGNYRLPYILLHVLLSVPGHVYELFPVATLIGAILALAQLAASSEYTVMRVSGVSAQRMALMLMQIGLPLMVASFIVGEYIAPSSERLAQQVRLKATSSVVAQEFRSGLWVKDEHTFVNVRGVLPDATLEGVNIFEFDPGHRLRAISFAKRGGYQGDNRWRLNDVTRTQVSAAGVTVTRLPEIEWRSVLNPEILNVLRVAPEQMSALSLYQYVEHLRENRQQTSRYEIALWNKLTYPFAVLVMLLLALPFGYTQRRTGGVSLKIFAGIMLGLGFHMLNQMVSRLGQLNDWPTLFSATFPTLLFLSAALAVMWMVERR